MHRVLSWVLLLLIVLTGLSCYPSSSSNQPTNTASLSQSQISPSLTLTPSSYLTPSPTVVITQFEKISMKNPQRTLNIAHRGARSLAPENTLAAARKGFEIGADLWELDVAMTRDGELILIHDDSFERTSNIATVYPDRKKARAHEFTLAELHKLDMGSWFIQTDPFRQIAAGAISKAELDRFVGEVIPTLREALQFTKDHNWQVNVEIKDASGTPSDSSIVEKVVALIIELNMTEKVMISSFNHSYIQRVKSVNPHILTAALVERPDPDPVALLRRLNAQAYNPSSRAVTPGVIKLIREAGFDVYIYTVNDEPTMRNLIDAGASGIFTDFPQLLKENLK